MLDCPRCGILLVNTGTPSSPEPRAVRKYLAQFLMDKRIAPMNRVLWWFILHFGILPKRGHASGAKYEKIWTDEGSPFMIAHERLVAGLTSQLNASGVDDITVLHAMSYGSPSILSAVKEFQAQGCNRLIVLPLYPQSAHSTTGSVYDSIERAFAKSRWRGTYEFVDNYHDHITYVRALAASIRHRGFDPKSEDVLLFSYHSIPLVDIEAGDTYELQCGASSLQIASELGIERKQWTIGYQCRFDKGRDWLSPYTSEVLSRWAETNRGNLYFVCPGFSVDCLETLYDIEYEIKPFYFEKVAEAGGCVEACDFTYVPCLDRTRAHAKVLHDIVYPYLKEPAHG